MIRVEPQNWIREPDAQGNGLLEAYVVSGELEYAIPIETHNVPVDDVTLGEEQDFDFIFECVARPTVYSNEDEYNSRHDRTSMATESVIPCGLLYALEDKEPTSHVILNGRVVETYDEPEKYGFEEGELIFTLTCLGNEYDVVVHAEFSEGLEIKKGNIVSALYWAQGWPAE